MTLRPTAPSPTAMGKSRRTTSERLTLTRKESADDKDVDVDRLAELVRDRQLPFVGQQAEHSRKRLLDYEVAVARTRAEVELQAIAVAEGSQQQNFVDAFHRLHS